MLNRKYFSNKHFLQIAADTKKDSYPDLDSKLIGKFYLGNFLCINRCNEDLDVTLDLDLKLSLWHGPNISVAIDECYVTNLQLFNCEIS